MTMSPTTHPEVAIVTVVVVNFVGGKLRLGLLNRVLAYESALPDPAEDKNIIKSAHILHMKKVLDSGWLSP